MMEGKMKFLKYFILILVLFTGCVSTEEMMKWKFSPAKKYAVIPFDCTDSKYGEELAQKVKVWLEHYNFEIIDDEVFQKNLSETGLTVEKIYKDYSKVIGKVNCVDAIMLGNVKIDKTSSVTGTGASIGSQSKYTDRCDVLVIDVKNGEVITSTTYISKQDAAFSWKDNIEEVAKKIVFQLLPH